MDRSASGMSAMCFFASSTPLRIASGTSSALPRPAPTWPRPSPTTTTAEKLNRRPPFTTLDTRLIWTTRSVSSSRFGSILAMSPPSTSLELQARLAGRVAERLHPAVIAVATAVEHDVADPGGLRALRDELADLLRALGLLLISRRRSLFDVEVGRGGERAAGAVIDDLRVDVRQRAEDREARPLSAAGDALAHARVAPPARDPAGISWHARPPLRGALADDLFVDPADADLLRRLRRECDPRRRVDLDRVRVAERERQLLAGELRAVPGAADLEVLRIALRDADDHVRDERARQSVDRARRLRVVAALHDHAAVLARHLHRGVERARELALRALHLHRAALDREVDVLRERDGEPADAAHLPDLRQDLAAEALAARFSAAHDTRGDLYDFDAGAS